MAKKMFSLFGFIICIVLLLTYLNPSFTFRGLILHLQELGDLRSMIHIEEPTLHLIPVPNIAGFSQLVRGINSIIELFVNGLFDAIGLIKSLPTIVMKVLDLIMYIIGI